MRWPLFYKQIILRCPILKTDVDRLQWDFALPHMKTVGFAMVSGVFFFHIDELALPRFQNGSSCNAPFLKWTSSQWHSVLSFFFFETDHLASSVFWSRPSCIVRFLKWHVWDQTEKIISTIRETSVCWHNGCLIKHPLKPPNTKLLWWSDGFQTGSQLGPHDAETR